MYICWHNIYYTIIYTSTIIFLMQYYTALIIHATIFVYYMSYWGLLGEHCIISPLLAVCAHGVTTQDTITLFHTRQEFKDPPNIQHIVHIGWAEKSVQRHVIGKKNGTLVAKDNTFCIQSCALLTTVYTKSWFSWSHALLANSHL